MRIPVEVDPDSYERINELVKEGRYSTLQQFISVAINNQLDLEESDTNESVGQIPSHVQKERITTNQVESTEQQNAETDSEYRWGYSVPENPPTRDPFSANRSDNLLFSQYYRFFPLKYVLIELAKKTNENDGPINLDSFRDYISQSVVPLRDEIVIWEEENGIKKQNKKSTGFPKEDVKNAKRSMDRFLNHFVGSIQKTKQTPSGFGHELGFLSLEPAESNSESWTICLTPSGEEFLRYENPLIAKGLSNDTLSSAEQHFIISHVRENLELEFEFMCYISDVIEGIDETYTTQLDEFRAFLASERAFGEDVSDNRVRSHTAGTISRMVDLGILTRGRRRGYYLIKKDPREFEPPTNTNAI